MDWRTSYDISLNVEETYTQQFDGIVESVLERLGDDVQYNLQRTQHWRVRLRCDRSGLDRPDTIIDHRTFENDGGHTAWFCRTSGPRRSNDCSVGAEQQFKRRRFGVIYSRWRSERRRNPGANCFRAAWFAAACPARSVSPQSSLTACAGVGRSDGRTAQSSFPDCRRCKRAAAGEWGQSKWVKSGEDSERQPRLDRRTRACWRKQRRPSSLCLPLQTNYYTVNVDPAEIAAHT